MANPYYCEEKLSKLAPDLHRRYSDSLLAIIQILTNYKAIFPEYTDHSFLHTLNVLNYCNLLIDDNTNLNSGEIYVMMMAIALHDTGMGISENDYEEFIQNPKMINYISNNSSPREKIIRDYHHELSGLFIKKYYTLFEIPKKYVYPVIQAARGHRVADLQDPNEYPTNYKAGAYSICLPYISALIRLADELDIAAERNIYLNQDISSIHNQYSLTVWKLHAAIKSISINNHNCVIFIQKSEVSDENELSAWINKLKKVMLYADKVINNSFTYTFTKKIISVKYL